MNWIRGRKKLYWNLSGIEKINIMGCAIKIEITKGQSYFAKSQKVEEGTHRIIEEGKIMML